MAIEVATEDPVFWMGVVLAVLVAFLFIGTLWVKADDHGYARAMSSCSNRIPVLEAIARERGRCIDELKGEIEDLKVDLEAARSMARKPLTQQQLDDCLAKGGDECPRCGNDSASELTYEDVEFSDDGPFQAVKCDDCQEQWIVTYKVVKVEAAEG